MKYTFILKARHQPTQLIAMRTIAVQCACLIVRFLLSAKE